MLIYEREDDGKIVQTLYLSDNGREYSVLDMLDFHHNTTSGMVAIMDNNSDGRIKKLLNMATWFATDYSEEDIESSCSVLIAEYEAKIGIQPLTEADNNPLAKNYFLDKYNNRCYVGDTVRLANCSNSLIIKAITDTFVIVNTKKPSFKIEPDDVFYSQKQMKATHLVEKAN